ncbi:hypothetical protein [Nocardioides nitrophenolicus]|nr:hypothetical protein [Nocardioides nitrophenolicus]MBM7517066.1 hypothetical protein [Nocardioides nitrophenolicus]
MRRTIVIASVLAVGAGLRYAAQRLATHQPVIPAVTNRVNTQVHRINQR